MFREHFSQTRSTEHQTSQLPRIDLNELSFGLLGLVDRGRETISKLAAQIEGHDVISSAHKNWDNVNYCRHLSQDAARQYSVPELINVFPANFRAFTDEYCLGSVVRQYPLAVNANGTTGFDTTYQETLATQAQRFQEEKIVHLKRHHQRGAVEVLNSKKLDGWLSQVCHDESIPLGTKLIWCSPPGFRVEGYHGVSGKHHSFIWVYEKTAGNEGHAQMTMTQFRCWPNLAQMEQIQRRFQSLQPVTPLLEQDSLNPNSLTRRNRVIHQLAEVAPDTTIDDIESLIYEGEDDWQVKQEDMPQVVENNVVSFEKYRDQLLAQFLSPMYQSLLQSEPRLTDPYNSPFWSSHEYKALIQKLDLVFAIAWQNLLRYVESVDGHARESIPTPQLNVDQLQEIFEIKLRSDDGKSSREDRRRFNDLAPTLLSVGSTTLSVGQCGLGTLIPVQLFKGIGEISGIGKFASLAELNKFDILKLSAADQLAFRTDVLGQYQPLTLISKFGKNHKFWVRSEYYSDYLEHSYQGADGKFYGPCDVPLESGDNFVMSDSKYQELFGATIRPNISTLAQLDSEELASLASVRSDSERDSIRNSFQKRRQKLKERVSVTELVNNDLFRPAFTRV